MKNLYACILRHYVTDLRCSTDCQSEDDRKSQDVYSAINPYSSNVAHSQVAECKRRLCIAHFTEAD